MNADIKIVVRACAGAQSFDQLAEEALPALARLFSASVARFRQGLRPDCLPVEVLPELHLLLYESAIAEDERVALVDRLLPVLQAAAVRLLRSPSIEAWSRGQGLSAGEAAVFVELCAGMTNVQISRKLFISPYTVRSHLEQVFAKLGVASRLEAVVKAHQAVSPFNKHKKLLSSATDFPPCLVRP